MYSQPRNEVNADPRICSCVSVDLDSGAIGSHPSLSAVQPESRAAERSFNCLLRRLSCIQHSTFCHLVDARDKTAPMGAKYPDDVKHARKDMPSTGIDCTLAACPVGYLRSVLSFHFAMYPRPRTPDHAAYIKMPQVRLNQTHVFRSAFSSIRHPDILMPTASARDVVPTLDSTASSTMPSQSGLSSGTILERSMRSTDFLPGIVVHIERDVSSGFRRSLGREMRWLSRLEAVASHGSGGSAGDVCIWLDLCKESEVGVSTEGSMSVGSPTRWDIHGHCVDANAVWV